MAKKLTNGFSFQELNPNKSWAIIHGKDGFEVPKGVSLIISKCGTEIIDPIHNKRYGPVRYKNKYLKINISYYGNYRYLLVHRLVAFAWLGIPIGYHKLIVNHKDGNTENNHADNLEWTTKSLNNRHAYASGLRKDTAEIGSFIVYDFDTKEVRHCFSLNHVSAVTGLKKSVVSKVRGVPLITEKGRFAYFYSDVFPGFNPEMVSDDMFINYKSHSSKNIMNVRVLNVETGEVRFYGKMSDAAKELGVPLSSISQQCNDPARNQWPIKGYIFTEVIDQAAPRKYLREKGIIDDKPRKNDGRYKELLVHDRETNTDMKFKWIGDFADYVSKKHNRPYQYKSIQHILNEKKHGNRPLSWKEFDFVYLN